MSTIVSFLLTYIEIQNNIISYLIALLFGKTISRSSHDEPARMPYRKLQVNVLPIIEIPKKLDYHNLHGKPLAPVKPHKDNRTSVPNTLTCPKCGALHIYLYDNTGGRGQYKCKVCSCLFSAKNYNSKAVHLKCPHCGKSLDRIKERKDFFVFKCKNGNRPFYIHNFRSMSKAEKDAFGTKPFDFKVRDPIVNFTSTTSL